jgi:hypothetical protein
MKTSSGLPIVRIVALGAAAVLLCGAVTEFYNIAWGTGSWYGEFSFKWGAGFVLFSAICAALLIACAVVLWREMGRQAAAGAQIRQGRLRWALGAIVVVAPIGLLQYSPLGVVLRGPYLRVLLWVLCIVALAIILAPDPRRPWTEAGLLTAILVSGSAFVIAAAVTDATSYPFSLGWSEGNRLWDYSLLFGKRLYSFDPNQEPVAYLDFGRQLIGGTPFLLPRVSILGERLWLAAAAIIPYMLVALLAFWPRSRTRSAGWVLASLLGFVFLTQGPIHAPLLVCAILVALAWRLPASWAAALVGLAGFFAETSRFTWMFAPAMWAVMLEIGGAEASNGRLAPGAWRRALVLGTAGLFGSALAYAGLFQWNASSVGSSAAVSTNQALLWYRLLPNATYGDGILLGLAKASAPMIGILTLAGLRRWKESALQVLVPAACLAAFLVVGLIISTKIGGGGDLHNLDMFLIALVFTAAILWKASGTQWTSCLGRFPYWMQPVIVLAVAIPAYAPLLSLRPISFARDADWLIALTDVERPRDLGSLPDAQTVEASLEQVRQAVDNAGQGGPVLFLDQRQLLTFGYVQDVELISVYEKKRLMDEALSENEAYFEPFYRDLAIHRFTMLVSSPLRTPIKDSEYGFGEENNAWVKWVAKPVLCYYEEMDTLDDVKVELLVPRKDPVDCAFVLPLAQQ